MASQNSTLMRMLSVTEQISSTHRPCEALLVDSIWVKQQQSPLQPLRRRTMKAVAAILIFKLFLPWGAPLRLIADQAFNNEEFQQLLEILKIKIRYTSPYKSRSNRSERYCGEVVRMIRTFLVDFGRNVDDKKFFGEAYDYLDYVVAAHNAKPIRNFFSRQPDIFIYCILMVLLVGGG